jgi:superfamily II DNA or RNA helicase
MKLSQALSSLVPARVRARGLEYFASGAVVELQEADGGIDAVIEGSAPYAARVEFGQRSVLGFCTCPSFLDRAEICKHLWAVILECDARGLAPAFAGALSHDIDFEPIYPDEYGGGTAPPPEPSAAPRLETPGRQGVPNKIRRSPPPEWQQTLDAIDAISQHTPPAPPPLPGRLLYVIDLAASRQSGTVFVHLMTEEQKKNGDWGVPKPARISTHGVRSLPADDREVLERLTGARPAYAWSWGAATYEFPTPFQLRGLLTTELVPLMCQTGRCRLALTEVPTMRPQDSPAVPLVWDDGPPWRFLLDVVRDEQAQGYVISGALHRGSDVMTLAQATLLIEDGLVFTPPSVARLEHGGALSWIRELGARPQVIVPFAQQDRLRDTLLASQPPVAALLEDLRVEVVDMAPRPWLSFAAVNHDRHHLAVDLSFDYEGTVVAAGDPRQIVRTSDRSRVIRRNPEAEAAALGRLPAFGIRSSWQADARGLVPRIAAAQLPRTIRHLVEEGWHVDAEGATYRLPTSAMTLDLRSGIDWFELHGQASFGEQTVALPRLLAAIERGHTSVELDDGTIGVLPESWMKTYGRFAIGAREADHLRFTPSQTLLLDAMLATQGSVSWDTAFTRMRDRLTRSDSIAPLDPPPTFKGALREYQREGLGWLTFLRELGFGGCLADDMGLGKTVMILALLEARRLEVAALPNRRPSLVVAPRSVIFNWRQEAARFTPDLQVLDYSGTGRAAQRELIDGSDLVLATYGTLRRDAARLGEHEFDYVILDEAQTIKNAGTASAKAARLMKGSHRVALSGTPVENRLSDLWSLFEFLNPGLLSRASGFAKLFSGKDADEETLDMLGRGLRPFILRRTKEQVASELPSKTEQTIECELERPQRLLYNELRDHYRRRLLNGASSWQRSKLQVLEALLRLRQAACHPGLIDPERAGEKSAKLDLLLPRIAETVAEGHKTLVFSQFTSFLSLLRGRLDAARIPYEYLDGRTRDRAARIDRFQNAPESRLFLISLTAGGLGLNLTSADYVFLLDPWWNPAAEAQAIDRAHRIGQTRNVFAYRLIARDTVEERVLELQQRKRALADAILNADNSIVSGLQREDLELLLS